MQKERKQSGFLNIISRMNESVTPIEVEISPQPKTIRQEIKETVSGVKELNINLVEVNFDQPRKNFDQEALSELAASITEHGIIQPIIVTQKEGKFIIVAGERRYRAAKLAGLNKVPVIIRELTDRERCEFSLIENLQREELNPIEEAEAMNTLLQEYNLTQEQLSTSLGKSRPAIANSIRLLKLPVEIIDMVRSNKLSGGHARALLQLKNAEKQINIAKEIILKKMSVREVEQKINSLMLAKSNVKLSPKISLELKAIERDMQRLFATKVKISGNDNKGKISIDYYSKDELQKIYELLEECKNK